MMKPTDEMQKTRLTIGRMFEQLPDLERAEFTIGGKRYRAHRSLPWVCIDAKNEGRGWDYWTEYPLPEWRNGSLP
ncbi:hypothetical protein JKG47_05340 [Acidithiobacillus sp. MC6.1]|nr:hypothetical protein [Acidithiobacillus sp. MC6.1]